jgi:ribose 5-phosphate isomerase B
MAKALVTEREIRAAAREGRKSLDVTGSVVTPAARDIAGTLGVSLVGDARSARGGAAARGAPPKKESTPARPASSNQSPAPATATPPSPANKPTIAVGADHGGVAMKTAIAEHLRKGGYTVTDLGTNSTEPVDYPDFAVAVAR